MNGAGSPARPDPACAIAAPPTPERLALWLGHGVTPTLCDQLAAVPRLAGRVARMVESRLGLPDSPSRAELAALSLDLLGLAALSWWAGIAWHARSLAAVIDGPRIRALADQVGPDARRLALRWSSMAPPGIAAVPTAMFAAAAAADGVACLEAWCDATTPSVGRRIALRLPLPAAQPGPAHRQHGPALVDRLLVGGHAV